jgi:hypothetical protein
MRGKRDDRRSAEARRSSDARSPRSGRSVAKAVVAITAFTLLAAPAIAEDEEPAPLNAVLGQSGDQAVVSFDVTGAFTETFRRRLNGGLTSRVVIEMTLVDEADVPVAYTVRECQIRLDVWDDVLYVLIRDANRNPIREKQIVIDRALKRCGEIDKVPIGESGALHGARYLRLAVAVSLNPVSSELLQHTREFMANPNDTRPGRPTSFFGTVARLFISKPNMGGERFVFKTGRLQKKPGEP